MLIGMIINLLRGGNHMFPPLPPVRNPAPPRPFTSISTPLCIKDGKNPHAVTSEIFNFYFKKEFIYNNYNTRSTEAMVEHVQQHIPPEAALQLSPAIPEVSQQYYDSSPNLSIWYSLDDNHIVDLRNLVTSELLAAGEEEKHIAIEKKNSSIKMHLNV